MVPFSNNRLSSMANDLIDMTSHTSDMALDTIVGL